MLTSRSSGWGEVPARQRSRRRRRSSAISLSVVAAAVFGLLVSTPPTASATDTSAPADIIITGFVDATGSCTITSTATSPNPTTCTTLRAAVSRANSRPGSRITLPAGTYPLTKGTLVVSAAGTRILGMASPVGASPSLIDGGRKRVFEVKAKNVTVAGVAITNGNASSSAGGAIATTSAATGFVLSESTIFGNTAAYGGGLELAASSLVERSTFHGNSASVKGGAIRASATVEVVNSTFTGNTAPRGGAISVYGSSAKGAISYSTFVDNTSYGSKGGGVDRYSGSLVVTGSILMRTGAATAGGSDCSNGPKLIGPNYVGNTQNCVIVNPPLTPTAPGPLTLGPLADNAGATQTMLPLDGGVGVDVTGVTVCQTVNVAGALGAPVTVDQRELARPSGPGAAPACDLGAVEITPLEVEIALTSSTPNPPVGATTIPAANIPAAVSETSALFDSSLSASPLRAFPLTAAPLRAFPLRAFPLRAFPLRAFFTSAAPLRAFDVEAFPLRAFPLDTILLSDLVLLTEGGWQKVLEGTRFEGVPLQALTLSDVQELVDDPAVDAGKRAEIAGLDFADLDLEGTPLRAFPAVAFLMGAVPLRAFPLRAFDGSPVDWCPQFPDFCTAGVLNADVTLASVVLAGGSLDDVDLTASPLGQFFDTAGVLEAFPLRAFPLRAFDIMSSPLRAFPLRAFPLRAFSGPEAIFDCSKVACDSATLGDAAASGAILDVALSKLIDIVATDVALAEEFDAYGLSDLLVSLIPPESVPWEQIDLDVAGLQNAAVPSVDPFQYFADLTLSTSAETAEVQLVLPTGFAYVPGGSTVGGVSIADPTLSVSTLPDLGCAAAEGSLVLTYHLTNLPSGPTRLAVPVRAGLTLGDAYANACVVAASGLETDDASANTAVTVVEQVGAPQSSIRPLTITDTSTGAGVDVSLGYVTGDESVDLFSFEVPAASANAGIQGDLFLSNLPADYDLVLYGQKSAALRNEPTDSIGYLDDVLFDLNPYDDQIQADTVQDIPQTLPGSVGNADQYVPVAISSNRGQADEQLQTGTLRPGTYYVQVSAYNGALSNQPYALRFRTDQSAFRPACSALSYPADIPAGSLPAVGSLDPDVNTLFLVNEQLLEHTYGELEAGNVLAAAGAVAAADEMGVVGAIIPVDGDPEVRRAYEARFGAPCEPLLANDVVRAIGTVIDNYTAEYPDIENIVIIGDDRQIPMANIVDDVNYANERTFAQNFAGNDESIAALTAGMYRTDDPYGSDAGIRVRDHELFVPERAVGRLVETPAQIVQSLENFVAFDGRLDPDTAESALQTGYEFLSDGAALNAENLDDGGYDVETLIDETWTDQHLIDALDAAESLDVIGLHAHFDENNALPAFDNANPTSPAGDLFSSDEFPNERDRAIVYSMGCHTGYSRSDIQVGAATPDWAQRLSGELGNVLVGNTGFGYGDSDRVALSELLTGYFAEQVAQDGSVGQAWVDAKQEMLSNLHVLDAYQEKVLQEFVFYGLPMFHVGSAPPDLSSGSAAPSPSTFSSPSAIQLEPSPIAGLSVGRVIATPTLARVDVAEEGSFYTANGRTLDVNGHPIQPLYTTDITSPAPGFEARDVLITGLRSNDVDPETFDPVFFKAATDFGQPRPEFFDGSFPAELSTVRSYQSEGLDRQQLLLAVGQYRGSLTNPDLGTQRLHTRVTAEVYYGLSNSADATPPAIERSSGNVEFGVASFEVAASDLGGSVERVYVLFRGNTGGNWTGLDLTRGPDGVWTGGRAVTGTDVEFAVQAVDASGNVAMSDSKSRFFLTAEPVEAGELVLQPVSQPVNGWYPGAVTIEAFYNEGESEGPIFYSVDGGQEFQYDPASPITISDELGHVITAHDDSGGFAMLFVAIDSTAPTAFIPPTPAYAAGDVPVTATFDDGAGSGVTSIQAFVGPPESLVPLGDPLSFDDPVRSGELTVTIQAPGETRVTFTATDAAGNTRTSDPVVVSIDKTVPVVTVSKTPATEYANTDVAVDIHTAADDGSPIAERWYTIQGDAPGTKRKQPLTEEGTYVVTGFAADSAGNIGQSATLDIKIDKTAPVPTLTVPTEAAVGSSVTAEFDCADPSSGVLSCVLTLDKGDGSQAVELSSTPGSVVLPTVLAPATYTLSVSSTDVAGNTAVPATSTVQFKQFALAPTVTLTSTQVQVGGVVKATFGCAGAESGVVSCTLSVKKDADAPVVVSTMPGASPVTLPTHAVGNYVVTTTATDLAGNTESVTASYTVAPAAPAYRVCLQYDPTHVKKSGSTYPIKVKLCDAAGNNLSSSGVTLVAKAINPGNFPPNDSGNSNPGFLFRYSSGCYTYNLKTAGLPAGSFTLDFVIQGDPTGTVYSAPFKLKR